MSLNNVMEGASHKGKKSNNPACFGKIVVKISKNCQKTYIIGVFFAFLSNSSACSNCSACPCDATAKHATCLVEFIFIFEDELYYVRFDKLMK